jgi:hypothetical protein
VFPVTLTLTDTTGLSSNVNFIVDVFPRSSFIGVPSNDSSTTSDQEIKVDIKVPLPNKLPNYQPKSGDNQPKSKVKPTII